MGLLKFIGQTILGIGAKKKEDTLVGSVVSRLIPDKQLKDKVLFELEKEYNKYKHEVQLEIEKIHPYEPKFSMAIKGSARWVIALVFVGFYIFARLKGLALTEFDLQIVGAIVGFAFLSRGVEKILGKAK